MARSFFSRPDDAVWGLVFAGICSADLFNLDSFSAPSWHLPRADGAAVPPLSGGPDNSASQHHFHSADVAETGSDCASRNGTSRSGTLTGSVKDGISMNRLGEQAR